MYLLYSLLLVIWGILLLPVFLYKSWRRHQGFAGIRERLGRLPDSLRSDKREVFWFHACSVGEALSLQPLAEALRKHFPGTQFVFSTITQTGREIAADRFAPYGEGNTFYFPVDFASVVKRVLGWIQPSMIIIVETEIWPNLLRQANRRSIPVVLLNGRISDRSFRSYRFARPFLKNVFTNYRVLMMQSEEDAERMQRLGAPEGKLTVTGNIKFDGDVIKGSAGETSTRELDKDLGLHNGDTPLIVAGSTHSNEEAVLLDVLKAIRLAPGLEKTKLLVAPRHPERFDAVADLIVRNGFTVKRRSRNTSADQDADVILLDTMGELAAAYSFATLVFVGGTLFRHGGHSIMEPALCSKPIVVGPSMENFRTILNEFLSNGGIRQIKAVGEDRKSQIRQLQEVFLRLLQNPAERAAMGHAARSVLDRNRGAVLHSVQAIISIYEEDRSQE